MRRQIILLRSPLRLAKPNPTRIRPSHDAARKCAQFSTSTFLRESSSKSIEDESENNDWHDLNTVMRGRLSSSTYHHNCQRCNKPLRPVQTINGIIFISSNI